jgi:hypothetical protein
MKITRTDNWRDLFKVNVTTSTRRDRERDREQLDVTIGGFWLCVFIVALACFIAYTLWRLW